MIKKKQNEKIGGIDYKNFLTGTPPLGKPFTFVSLFSGAGIGDYGLKLAGGLCLAACEIDPHRSAVHRANIGAHVWGNIREDKENLIATLDGKKIDLLIATPPCQGFSTANARRGLREDPNHASKDERNHLFFEALYVARKLKPTVIIFENVPNFLVRKIRSENGKMIGRVHEFISASLSEYVGLQEVICFSEIGVPQRRRRSVAIFVRNDKFSDPSNILTNYLSPENWPAQPSGTPSNIIEAINDLQALDGIDETTAISPLDPLHQVPHHSEKHYSWISSIPHGSGKSAWENKCSYCGDEQTPIFTVHCNNCGAEMKNRPHVANKDGSIRAIKGFKTSYKRMLPNELAPTITTASGHFSSDLKLHPTQNRVLSARECARLQAIPDSFTWPPEQHFRKGYLIREMIGEAVPPLVTYRFGIAIANLINASQL
ncbi:DNA cytosine methyltransferase [Chromobacterium alticapitis]|uniref:DNA (cytosine-5-)-methyltransferase n=2 Tax=Chromobacterium alticapitis TaxID=2073169 RepID=A0A2S5DFZ4_9NEIS|nr:DNA cytosine methyltransferase [Chromobacterium alticapitis]